MLLLMTFFDRINFNLNIFMIASKVENVNSKGKEIKNSILDDNKMSLKMEFFESITFSK